MRQARIEAGETGPNLLRCFDCKDICAILTFWNNRLIVPEKHTVIPIIKGAPQCRCNLEIMRIIRKRCSHGLGGPVKKG